MNQKTGFLPVDFFSLKGLRVNMDPFGMEKLPSPREPKTESG
jgi:hypothetical protein